MGTGVTLGKDCYRIALLCTDVLVPQVVCRPDPQRAVCCVLAALAPGEQGLSLLGGPDHGSPCLVAYIALGVSSLTETLQQLCS